MCEQVVTEKQLRVAAGRIVESEDDELAYAYYAANESERRYDRDYCRRAYARRAYAVCRQRHVAHGITMIFKVVGLTPNGLLAHTVSRLAWRVMRTRAIRLERAAA